METEWSIVPCTQENVKTILDGINAYNLSKVPALSDLWTPLDFVVKDKNGLAVAGLLAGMGYWNGLEIKILWVKESHRKQGLGTIILRHVEELAYQKGATMAMLDTFDFQAADFYRKNGYQMVGTIENFPKGHRRIYFSKELTDKIEAR